MASIYDIANRAGVSISTVSRILNGTARVKPEKEKAVREAMEYYHYEPNQFARGLVKQKSNMIGLFLPSYDENGQTLSDYYLGVIRGVSEVLPALGYNLVLLFDNSSRASNPEFLEQLRQKRVDGIIFAAQPAAERDRQLLSELEEAGYPIVYIGQRFEDRIRNVYAQFVKYHYNSISYLYGRGHRRILLFGTSIHASLLEEVYEKAVKELPGINLSILFQGSSISYEAFKKEIQKHLEEGIDAVAGIGADQLPFLYGCLAEAGLKVPEDVSVLATEFMEGAGLMFYPETSAVYVPASDMGKAAAELLASAISKSPDGASTIELESVLKERDSVRTID